jgi:hypothetical protein
MDKYCISIQMQNRNWSLENRKTKLIMKAELNKWMQDVTFNYLMHNLGIEPAPKKRKRRNLENGFIKWVETRILQRIKLVQQ